MNKISALWGAANSGKTSTLKLVHEKLQVISSGNIAEISISNTDSDIRDIFTISGKRVGIETQGDPNSRLKESLELFKKYECNYIICACRSRGSTVDLVDALKPVYHISWRGQSSVSEKGFRFKSNEAVANLIFDELVEFLNA
ncbi:MAG: hypothetical protein K2X80_01825 [Pseudomonadaceae bacterium]|nr:hypothetical protein [Pseudomonadaceae bacterium]